MRMTEVDRLAEFVGWHSRLFVLTGAGCSTGSGIPDYRDEEGRWKRPQPMTLQVFLAKAAARRRYWARSLVGWERFQTAAPNIAHRALARLEQRGKLELLLTQNVDGLHQAAGSRAVIDLHGRLDRVRCLGCGSLRSRAEFQAELSQRNPRWRHFAAASAPDGDADLDGADFSRFDIPACQACGGVLKPDVVFYGEGVPRERVEAAKAHLRRADALLIVGSSLMVYSGYRFAEFAAAECKPMAAVNLGRTRADNLLTLKVQGACEEALAFLVRSA
jgi:NAD-dependent SIR2 family protein deacetylase